MRELVPLMGAGDVLGADMHGCNVRVPDLSDGAARAANSFFGVAPFNLTNAMSKLLALAMTLPQVLATVTSNPARTLRMEGTIGSLQVGREADITVLDVLDKRFELADKRHQGDGGADDRPRWCPAR